MIRNDKPHQVIPGAASNRGLQAQVRAACMSCPGTVHEHGDRFRETTSLHPLPADTARTVLLSVYYFFATGFLTAGFLAAGFT
ncbi:MAG: hypothetical protein ACYDH4_11600, partial [Candidatus Cryosericum sp.]